MAKLKILVNQKLLEFDKNCRIQEHQDGSIEIIDPQNCVVGKFKPNEWRQWYVK